MTHYFKTSRDSETGMKLQKIIKRMESFNLMKDAFVEKYNIRAITRSNAFLCGIMNVEFKGDFDKELWKCEGGKAYSPRKRVVSKDSKKREELDTLLHEWNNLKEASILRVEIDEAFGGNDPFLMGGFTWKNPSCFILITEDPQLYKFPVDCEEISNLEYAQLTA